MILVDLYIGTDKEYVRSVGEEHCIPEKAMDNFKYTGYEHKMTYSVNPDTGDSILVAVDDRRFAND